MASGIHMLALSGEAAVHSVIGWSDGEVEHVSIRRVRIAL